MKHINGILFVSVLTSSFSIQAGTTILFQPPTVGSPSETVGAGTRHSNDDDGYGYATRRARPAPSPIIGAPSETVGAGTRTAPYPTMAEKVQLLATYKMLTATATPTLYWYASSIPPYNIEIAVQHKNKLILSKNIGVIKTQGMQSIRLADYGVQLKSNEDYTWRIRLLSETNKNTGNVLLASATIRYQQPTKPLNTITEMTQAGYWYDAIALAIQTNNSAQLSNLLSQEGITLK